MDVRQIISATIFNQMLECESLLVDILEKYGRG
uniref:Uncharacterized protein n=1 Tax=Rhizophora mucronata TaxID=61149 RepID=A0A2P2QEQ8_RHIMU